MRSTIAISAAASLLASQSVAALDLNVNDQQSVKDAAKTIAKDLFSYYKGNTDSSQVGLLPKPPYYWWESGAMFGTMVHYSYLTGDNQYNDDVAKGIYSQVSPTKDFMMMKTQANNLGNDDQAFWGLTAIEAAEHKLPVPEGAPSDIWLTAASGAFNDFVERYNTSTCGGGLKWQFQPSNSGFYYKSSIANAAPMQIGARLALLTGNQTYADKAAMMYNWMQSVGYISDSFQVFDGAGDAGTDNCTKIDKHEWSYNSASLIGGAAALSSYYSKAGNADAAKTWTDRTEGLWKHATENFFKDGVLYEQACEDVGTCNTDQKSFKAYLARFATFAGQVVPSIMPDVQSKLQSTAAALAKSCTGDNDNACGMKWYDNVYSGETGVGEEMSALEVVIGLLGGSVKSDATGSQSSSSSSAPASSATSSAATSAIHSDASSAAHSPVPTTMQTQVKPNISASAPTTDAASASAHVAAVTSSPAAASPEPCMENENGVPYMTAPVA